MTQQHVCVGPVLRQPGAVVVESNDLARGIYSTASSCDECVFGAFIRLPILVYVVTKMQEVVNIVLSGGVPNNVEVSTG